MLYGKDLTVKFFGLESHPSYPTSSYHGDNIFFQVINHNAVKLATEKLT